MAYSQNWNPKDKLGRDELVKALTEIAPMLTDGAFHVRFESDDGGTVVTIYAEGKFHENTYHLTDDDKFRGWRICRTIVSEGYINCFFNTKAKD